MFVLFVESGLAWGIIVLICSVTHVKAFECTIIHPSTVFNLCDSVCAVRDAIVVYCLMDESHVYVCSGAHTAYDVGVPHECGGL